MPLDFIVNNLQVLLLISVRIFAMLMLLPVISNANTPILVRLVLSVLTAYIIKNVFKLDVFVLPNNIGIYFLMIISEAFIGAIIGFYIQIAYMLINGISEYFSILMGMRAVQVLNPLSGESSAVITQFMSITVMFIFISSYSIQKFFYYGIYQSFLAVNSQHLLEISPKSFMGFIFYNFSKLFERSFVIALPFFITLFIINIGLGLFGKVAPQINLLVLGLPMQLALGLLFLFLFIPVIINAFEAVFDNAFEVISTFLRAVKV